MKRPTNVVPVHGILVPATDAERIKRIADALFPASPVDVSKSRARKLAVLLAEDVLNRYRSEIVSTEKK